MDDCGDNSDEDTLAGPICPKTEGCKSDYFQCNISKQCIPLTQQCDGIHDCNGNDNSDEQDCGKLLQVPYSSFTGFCLDYMTKFILLCGGK